MESIKGKIAMLQRLNWRVICRVALALLVAGLLTWACISTSNASYMQKKYAAARSAVGEALYGCASMMALEYDAASLAGADVEGDILPQMRMYFAQAQALNNAMAAAYGDEYAVLDQELIQEIELAFSEYEAAFSAGRSTDAAELRMTDAMTGVREALSEYYDDSTLR